MEIPVSPPKYDDISRAIAEKDVDVFLRWVREASAVDQKGRYLHWDKLRHLTLPEGINHDEW